MINQKHLAKAIAGMFPVNGILQIHLSAILRL